MMTDEGKIERGKTMREIGIILLVLVAWFVLNRWVLPWFGVST